MYVVEMKNITKQYPLVLALDHVDFHLKQGEIVSLLGENGAGKSTLMKILYGICKPDEGDIKIDGKLVAIKSPKHAIELGIGMVHQHFMLTPVLSVTENIVAGCEPGRGLFFDKAEAEKEVQAIIERYGFQIKASQKVGELSVGEQQKVEILKAVYRKARILILDEPTAVLTPQEVEELFHILRELKNNGTSIVLITHKLKETMEIADSISVLRDGKLISTDIPVENTTLDNLAQMMVGREVALGIRKRSEHIGKPKLSVRNIYLEEKGRAILKNICFDLKAGEILGIAGIEGNGQTELIECMTGIRKANKLEILHEDKLVTGNPKDFIQEGIGHIPEDRMTRGLILELSIKENLILGYQDRFQKKGILNRKEIENFTEELLKSFQIKAPNTETKCNMLSGGNQQKVVVARVFSENPDVLVVAQPTRGVDIGAIEYIHERLLSLRDEGKAILLISADLDEVKNLSDRLMVIYDGEIVAEGKPEEFTDMQLGLLMAGVKKGVERCEKNKV